VRTADGEEILDPPALSKLEHPLRPLVRALGVRTRSQAVIM
jgi:hypothetical protein